MKRMALYIALLICFAPAHAQKIEFRKIIGDDLMMRTEFVPLYSKNQKPVEIAMSYYCIKGEEEFALLLRFLVEDRRIDVPYGAKTKLKTTQGTIIDTVQELDNSITEFNPRSGISTQLLHQRYIYGEGNYIIVKYVLTMDDLQVLAEEGLVKIRMQTTQDLLEWEYPEKEFLKVSKERQEVNRPKIYLNQLYTTLNDNIDPYTTF